MGEPPPDVFDPAPPADASAGSLNPHRGPVIFLLGVLGLAGCFPLGAIAWSMGNRDVWEMERNLTDPRGYGPTAAGRILGKASVILAVLFLVAALAALLT